MSKETIVLGAGEVYLYEFNGATIPLDDVIETPANNVGSCSGGFSVEYKPEVYDVLNQYGKIVKRFIPKEEVTAKTGILKWDLDKIALLSAAKITTDGVKKIKKLTIGNGKTLKTVLLRFVHVKDTGKKIRFTMIGQGGNGFSLDFSDKETVIDSEIKAISYINNFLAEFAEEMDDPTP